MAKTPFGLTTLMESLRHSEEQQMESQLLFEAVTGANGVSPSIKDQFIEDDMDDDVDEDDPELNKLLDLIPEEDDEEEMLDKLDNVLEAAIVQDMNGKSLY